MRIDQGGATGKGRLQTASHRAQSGPRHSLLLLESISHCSPSNFQRQSCAPVTVLLKTFQWLEEGLLRVALGTEDTWAQVSLVLKGNPNKNLNEWYVQAIQERIGS